MADSDWSELHNHISKLCSEIGHDDGDSLYFKKYLKDQTRTLSEEIYPHLIEELDRQVGILLRSEKSTENLGGLIVVENVISVTGKRDATLVSMFSKHVYSGLIKTDREVIKFASSQLGRLAEAAGVLTTEEMGVYIKTSLDWLKNNTKSLKYSAVLVLQEMVEHAQTVFNEHINSFVELIWAALIDEDEVIQEQAKNTLHTCLLSVEAREELCDQWYDRLLGQANGVDLGSRVSIIFGSLIVVEELLRFRSKDELLISRHKQVRAVIFKFLNHENDRIKDMILKIMPAFVHFQREETKYKEICLRHVLLALSLQTHSATIALGKIVSGFSHTELEPYVTSIVHPVVEIIKKQDECSLVAIVCLGKIAKVMGLGIRDSLDCALWISIFSHDITTTLVDAIQDIGDGISTFMNVIEDRLLDLIETKLAYSKHDSLIALSRFRFQGNTHLEFAANNIDSLLDINDATTREHVTSCYCNILENFFFHPANKSSYIKSDKTARSFGKKIFDKLRKTADECIDMATVLQDILGYHRNFDELLEQENTQLNCYEDLSKKYDGFGPTIKQKGATCWAVASTKADDIMKKIRLSESTTQSPKEIVDFYHKQRIEVDKKLNGVVNGGNPKDAFEFIKTKGLPTLEICKFEGVTPLSNPKFNCFCKPRGKRTLEYYQTYSKSKIKKHWGTLEDAIVKVPIVMGFLVGPSFRNWNDEHGKKIYSLSRENAIKIEDEAMIINAFDQYNHAAKLLGPDATPSNIFNHEKFSYGEIFKNNKELAKTLEGLGWHAMVVIGKGGGENGTPKFWKSANSYGQPWGYNGDCYLLRDPERNRPSTAIVPF